MAAVSLMASDGETLPRSLTLMGGPIDTRNSPTKVNDLATTKPLTWFKNNVIHEVPQNYPGHRRKVYPGFLQHAGFLAMNPSRHVSSHWDFYEDLLRGDLEDADSHRKFYDEYNAVLDMPAEYYLDTIRTVFQEHLLPRGEWYVRGQRVAPEAIGNTALFTIEGELDDISGLGQTQATHGLTPGIADANKRHLTVEGAGHYGIFSGRRWREVVYPEVKKFILAHQPVPAPTATQASESEPSITPTRPAATKKAAKKQAAAKPAAAAKPVGTVAEASFAAPTPTRSTAVTNKKAVPAKRGPAKASGKSAPRTARSK